MRTKTDPTRDREPRRIDPLSRASARLDLVLERLVRAKDATPENFFPIEMADAEALFQLVWDAQEDLCEMRDAFSGQLPLVLTPRLYEVINVDEPVGRRSA